MRNPNLIVYGSSYDRGLIHLLEMWPDIKAAVPEAELHVFYGWNLFDIAYGNNPERMAWKEKINKLMDQPGITHLGRISHEAVKVETEKAGIWAYPTHFGEISCINAMKAQAYGAIPVVIDYAALKETVQYGVKVEGDIYDQETKEEFKKQLIDLLKDPERQEEIRKEMIPWAQKFAWSNVAKQWSEEFKGQPSLERQVEELMEDNQALKAWDLVKDTNSPLKERVWLRVKHAFNEEDYKKYYSEDLVEYPVSEEVALDCTKLAPRFAWVVPKILELKPMTLLDLGCADGYLCLTIANKLSGTYCNGWNLYKPSIERAVELSSKYKLLANFRCDDLFNYDGDTTDVVVMMEVLEHLPDPRKGVEHAMSLLNQGGTAFFSTPRVDHVGVQQHKNEQHENWDDSKPAGHLRLFTENEFKSLFDNYEIIEYFLDSERCMCIQVKNK